MFGVSVVIPTYNRVHTLASVLDALTNQQNVVLNIDYEIIVSDNNSSDNTRDMVMSFRDRYGVGIRYVFEPTQGRQHALNRAIPLCKYDWIWFTDDDVVIPEFTLFRIRTAILAHREDNLALIGGKIYPVWEGLRPLWFTDDYLGCVGINAIDKELILNPYDCQKLKVWNVIFGANMIIKKSVFEEVGLYGKDCYYTEDTDMVKRICQKNYSILISPDIAIGHRISSRNMTKEYLMLWFWRRGFTTGRQYSYTPKWYHFLGVPWEVLFNYFVRKYKALFSFNENTRLRYQIEASRYMGVIEGIKSKHKGYSMYGQRNNPRI